MQNDLREALDRLKMAAHVYEDDEMAADCETLEALLSTRPLALGGQQGVARWGLKDDNGVIQCLTYDDKTSAEVAANRCSVRLTPFPLYATPARAEAQDEGAEMTRLLKLADSALANVTAFEDDARYIMGNTNYAITENARSEIRSFLLAQSAKTSVRPKALEILERLLDHSGACGSFDAMKHGDAVKDAEELLRSARSPGHTDLMVTPESIDAYMKDNPMEAQDEGAAGDLKPCPFCGGEAEIIHLADDDNAGGSCVCCTKCQASGNVEFGRKENFVENWNRRAHPSPTPAADDDRVLQDLADRVTAEVKRGADGSVVQALGALSNIEGLVLAALKSTAAKEGGEL